jgi:hypothetical protein
VAGGVAAVGAAGVRLLVLMVCNTDLEPKTKTCCGCVAAGC